MDFRARLSFLRISNEYTMEELGKKIGVSRAAIGNYEAGTRYPKKEQLEALADVFNVDLDYLTGRSDIQNRYAAVNTQMNLSMDEAEHIKKYRSIDDRGRQFVDYILDEEYHRAEQIKETEETDIADYLYLGRVAAAGTWIYPGDIPLERIAARKMNGADFVVGVSGDSMQPTFEDGDKVYVKKTTDIEFGDIGLFVVNGYYYIKEYAPDGLRSHNPKYNLIPKDAGIIVVGKVLDKV